MNKARHSSNYRGKQHTGRNLSGLNDKPGLFQVQKVFTGLWHQWQHPVQILLNYLETSRLKSELFWLMTFFCLTASTGKEISVHGTKQINILPERILLSIKCGFAKPRSQKPHRRIGYRMTNQTNLSWTVRNSKNNFYSKFCQYHLSKYYNQWTLSFSIYKQPIKCISEILKRSPLLK